MTVAVAAVQHQLILELLPKARAMLAVAKANTAGRVNKSGTPREIPRRPPAAVVEDRRVQEGAATARQVEQEGR